MIELRNISKTYIVKKDKVEALKEINYSFPNHGLYIIFGKSGSGKSTLLNIISSLDEPTTGEVLVGNININKLSPIDKANYRNSTIGFVFQNYNLIEELSVFENVLLGLELQGKRNDFLVDNILKKLNIYSIRARNVGKLSGGEKARVALARALVKSPKIILADEPTGNLDSKTSDSVMEILKSLSKDHLVIVVTHKLSAKMYSDNILTISNGKIENCNFKKRESSSIEIKNYKVNLKIVNKIAFKIFNFPTKLFFLSMLIIVLSLFFFSLTTIFSNININKTHSLALIENKQNNIIISKKDNTNLYTKGFNQKEQIFFKKILNDKYTLVSNLLINNSIFTFNYIDTTSVPDYYKFYDYSDDNTNIFIDIQENKFSYIGKKPKQNEILISNFLADYILRFNVKTEDGLLNATNYQDLINKTIISDGIKLKISGIYIVDEELNKKEYITELEGQLIQKYLYTYFVDQHFFENNWPINESPGGTLFLEIANKEFLFMEDDIPSEQIIISKELAKTLNSENLIGKKFTFEIVDKYNIFPLENQKYELEIIDITDTNIISTELVKNFVVSNQLVRHIIAKDLNYEQLVKLFSKTNDKIEITTTYSDKLNNLNNVAIKTNLIFERISFLFLVLSLLVMGFFIHFDFKNNEKNIATLLAIGAKEKLIKTVFRSKTILIGIISAILSYILITLGIIIGNILASNQLGFEVKLFFVDLKHYFFISILIIIILIILNIIHYLQIKRFPILKKI